MAKKPAQRNGQKYEAILILYGSRRTLIVRATDLPGERSFFRYYLLKHSWKAETAITK